LAYREDSVEGRLLAGDREAAGQVIRWISTVIATPRFWRLRSEWLDLYQEAMGRVLDALQRGRFDEGRDFRTYVQGVARFTGMESLRPGLHLSQSENLDEAGESDAPDIADEVAARQLARQVLENASEGCRELLLGYYYRQKSYDELALAIGAPLGTVKSRLARCLDAAHRFLGG
jgi:RNA polymerase sigma factor (sigma-70 family)